MTTHEQIRHLVFAGASVRIDARRHTPEQLHDLSLLAAGGVQMPGQKRLIEAGGGIVTLTNLAHLDARSLQSIAHAGGRHVTFDFT